MNREETWKAAALRDKRREEQARRESERRRIWRQHNSMKAQWRNATMRITT